MSNKFKYIIQNVKHKNEQFYKLAIKRLCITDKI